MFNNNGNKNNNSSEIRVSLGPEIGSLYHSYHSKLSAAKNINEKIMQKEEKEGKNKVSEEKVYRHNLRLNMQSNQSGDFFNSPKRMEKYPNLEMTDFLKAQEEAESHCSKKFHLKDSYNVSHAQWTLPPSNKIYTHQMWKVDELLSMKEELNAVKGQLDQYDIESWHKHTHSCNPASKISYAVRWRAKPELLTQAFLKFYEILHAFPIIPEEDSLPNSSFKSLHLCEAPGAFIVALNHFLSLHRPNIKWQWIGNTLNPHFEGTPSSECIADDRFILHTLDNWFFGKDQTGNLMNPDYLNELCEYMGGRHRMNLVTADGSIDCQGNPAEQEAMTHALHFCEVYSALKALHIGGSLVLKKFTFFEADSVNLVYLICCCFNDVYIFKPTTSKLGNSEVYLVAVGYNSPPELSSYLEGLNKYYGKQNEGYTMFNKEQISSNFLNQIIQCSEFFKQHQVNAIKRNIKLFNDKSEHQDQYSELLKSMVLSNFIERNNCRVIEKSEKLVKHKLVWDREIIPEKMNSKWGIQIMKKSKLQRIQHLNLQFDECIKIYEPKFIDDSGVNKYDYKSWEYSQSENVLQSLSLKRGKPFHFVYVSRFCHENLLKIFVYYFMESVSEEEFNLTKTKHHELKVCNGSNTSDFKLKLTEITSRLNREHKDIMFINEGFYPGPHNCLNKLGAIIDMIYRGEIMEGKDFALFNCPLFTRLQVGLLIILSTLFKKVKFHKSSDICDWPPYITLENFISVEKGYALTKSLENLGCYEGQLNSSFNQILPLEVLINNEFYSPICQYNAFFSIYNIWFLRNYIKNVSG